MKLRTILNEIGDSIKVYDYDKYSLPQIGDKARDGNVYKVNFVTDKGTKYIVQMFVRFVGRNELGIEVEFKTAEDGYDAYSTQTNRYEVFSVMATISDILLNTLKDNSDKIKFIEFSPTKTENDRYTTPADKTQRGKLYLAYVKSKLSTEGIPYKVQSDGETVIIKLF